MITTRNILAGALMAVSLLAAVSCDNFEDPQKTFIRNDSPEEDASYDLADGNITFQFNDSTTLVGTNHVTPSGHATFQWQRMGTVHLAPGIHELTITSQQPDSWLRLRQFRILEIR